MIDALYLNKAGGPMIVTMGMVTPARQTWIVCMIYLQI
jgi:hypothetical protein